MEKVLSVILNHNGKKYLNDLLFANIKSLIEQSYLNNEIIFIDNASSDDSVESVKKHFPSIHIIQLHKNHMTSGYNFGIRYALKNKIDFVLLSNNDIVYQKDFIEKMVNFAKKYKDSGMITPKIIFLDDRKKINSTGLVFNSKGYAYDRDFNEYEEITKRENGEITGCSGGAMFLRTKVVNKIGYLEKIYQAYYEDVDYSMKLRRFTNYKIYFNPDTICFHKFSGSWKNRKVKDYLMNRNRIFFIILHFPLFFVFQDLKYLIVNQKNESKELNYFMYIEVLFNLPLLFLKRLSYLYKTKKDFDISNLFEK